MTVLTRWYPYREFNTLQDRMNRLFRDSFSPEAQDRVLGHVSFAPRRGCLRRRAQHHAED